MWGIALVLFFNFAAGQTLATATAQDPAASLPLWRDASLSFAARAADLVRWLNASELATLVAGPSPYTLNSSALGHRAILGGPIVAECLAGLSGGMASLAHPGAHTTAFPHMVNMGARPDTALVRAIGSAIGSEVRAAYNVGQHGSSSSGGGIGGGPPGGGGDIGGWTSGACLCPVLNVARDPRWGRSYESFGEDPTLIGALGSAYVKGLQLGSAADEAARPAGSRYIKIASIAKVVLQAALWPHNA